MIELVPLFTAVVDVEPSLAIGEGPHGARSIGAISSANVTGERIKATLASPAAADWLTRSNGVNNVDVRLALRTDDGALIYVTYGGRLDLSNPAQGMYARVSGGFETGDARYAWLNQVHAVGKGKLSVKQGGAAQLEYEFYEVR